MLFWDMVATHAYDPSDYKLAGFYDQRFYWSLWVIESDNILQSRSTLKLLSNDGSLINKKLIV